MELNNDNLLLFASKAYINENCLSYEEFLKDFDQHKLIKRLVKKIVNKKSINVRLLCNHVLCFTNNFELEKSKKILFLETSYEEKMVLKTVLNYFGFLKVNEFDEIKFCLSTAKALKEMDNE